MVMPKLKLRERERERERMTGALWPALALRNVSCEACYHWRRVLLPPNSNSEKPQKETAVKVTKVDRPADSQSVSPDLIYTCVCVCMCVCVGRSFWTVCVCERERVSECVCGCESERE